jgi:hypothetical protein
MTFTRRERQSSRLLCNHNRAEVMLTEVNILRITIQAIPAEFFTGSNNMITASERGASAGTGACEGLAPRASQHFSTDRAERHEA